MKVVLNQVACGPNGNAFHGTVLDIPKDQTAIMTGPDGNETEVPMGDYLIKTKQARAYDQQKDAKARQHGFIKSPDRQ